jgi:hypothetical protein
MYFLSAIVTSHFSYILSVYTIYTVIELLYVLSVSLCWYTIYSYVLWNK